MPSECLPYPRHPRAGGDPGGQAGSCHSALDSRLRGNDGLMRGFAFPLPRMLEAHACGATVHNRRVPAKAGTFQVPAPSDVRGGSCVRRSAEGVSGCFTPHRHPRAGGDPGGQAGSCHMALDSRLRGNDGLMRGFAFPLPLMSDAHACAATVHNRRVPAKAGTFQVPAPSDVRGGSCFRRSTDGGI
jgi:hypothetical protein